MSVQHTGDQRSAYEIKFDKRCEELTSEREVYYPFDLYNATVAIRSMDTGTIQKIISAMEEAYIELIEGEVDCEPDSYEISKHSIRAINILEDYLMDYWTETVEARVRMELLECKLP